LRKIPRRTGQEEGDVPTTQRRRMLDTDGLTMNERFQDSKIDTLKRRMPSRSRYQQKKR